MSLLLADLDLAFAVPDDQHVREIVDEKIRPTMEHIRELPTVQVEIKHLKHKIDALEDKLKGYEKKKPRPGN